MVGFNQQVETFLFFEVNKVNNQPFRHFYHFILFLSCSYTTGQLGNGAVREAQLLFSRR